MEITTVFNPGDKVWCMKNNTPYQFQIYKAEIEVTGKTVNGSNYLSGEVYISVCYVERDPAATSLDKDKFYSRSESDCYASKRELLNSFLSKEDLEDGGKI